MSSRTKRELRSLQADQYRLQRDLHILIMRFEDTVSEAVGGYSRTFIRGYQDHAEGEAVSFIIYDEKDFLENYKKRLDKK